MPARVSLLAGLHPSQGGHGLWGKVAQKQADAAEFAPESDYHAAR